ncbi:hypothetical protein GCM10025771_02360 [Niveibacterium umoris]|uniref:Lipoprotein n=1 Tax=Niveibacterium umoris TaxID=1193620 RepID=A0A840BKX9_9RHOO|nr:hypothetical protein [Niveibacterium umoris]MBB4014221.1 hypothetical protein [Niveibacterium umoris]
MPGLRGIGRALSLGVVLVAAGCETPSRRGADEQDEVFEKAKPPVVAERAPSGKGADRPLPPAPLKATEPAPAAPSVGRPKKAMEAKPLNASFRCASHDERHHIAQADVEVTDGNVKYLRARLATPLGGVCEFGLPDFTQTQRMPSVELKARSGRCTLRMWEQGPKVTLAYSNCEQYCKPGNTMDYILPILYDRRVNRCN